MDEPPAEREENAEAISESKKALPDKVKQENATKRQFSKEEMQGKKRQRKRKRNTTKRGKRNGVSDKKRRSEKETEAITRQRRLSQFDGRDNEEGESADVKEGPTSGRRREMNESSSM